MVDGLARRLVRAEKSVRVRLGALENFEHGLVAQRGRGTASRAPPVEVRILPRPLEARTPGKEVPGEVCGKRA